MKMKKLAVALSALALAACVATPAMARVGAVADDPTANGEPYITKVINTYQGVEDLSGKEINFTITKADADLQDHVANAVEPMPTVKPMTGFTTDGKVDDKNEVHWYGKVSIDLSSFKDKHPGKYVYTVKEDLESDPVNWIKVDGQVYTLNVFVKNDGTVKATVENAESQKVDTNAPADNGTNGFVFSNDYGIDTVGMGAACKAPKTKLTITKTINAVDPTQEFTIKLRYWTPGATAWSDVVEQKLTPGEAKTASAVIEIPQGSVYQVIEDSVAHYTGKYSTVSGVANRNLSDLDIANDFGDAKNFTTDPIVGTSVDDAAANSVTVANTREDVSITGLALNNAPFILMIGIPVAVAALWVAKRRRA